MHAYLIKNSKGEGKEKEEEKKSLSQVVERIGRSSMDV